MICGYTDRYVIPGEKGWWRRWCWEPDGHKGSHFRPPTPERSFGEVLAEMRAKRLEAERLETEPQEPEFVVTSLAREVEISELPNGPKKVMVWLAQNPSWKTRVAHSGTHHRPELYADDSKATGAKKGDEKRPERDEDHWFIQGALRVQSGDKVLRAALRASWKTVGRSTTFESALIRDNFEEFLDPDVAGATEYVVTSTGEFEEWLRALAPTGAPVKKEKAVKQSEATADDLLMKGEWTG